MFYTLKQLRGGFSEFYSVLIGSRERMEKNKKDASCRIRSSELKPFQRDGYQRIPVGLNHLRDLLPKFILYKEKLKNLRAPNVRAAQSAHLWARP
jgi:hypothetical protein